MVEKCPLVTNGLVTCVDMNVLSLGSSDVPIIMDLLEAHRENIDCYNKTFECLDEERNLRVVKEFPKSDLWKEVFSNIVEEVLWEMLESVCNSCFGGSKE